MTELASNLLQQPYEGAAEELGVEKTGWQASLDIQFIKSRDKTILKHVKHVGPLRVQRPFYPEGNDTCHLYLLHPPGGMVTGDALRVCINQGEASHSLLTTPSAGKIYRGDASAQNQYQSIDITLQPAAMIEWFPQETIVFDGARGELQTKVTLAKGAQAAFWDIVCLGRPASGEVFEQGYLVQNLLLEMEGITQYRERNKLQGGADLLQAPWGLANQPVTGTMVITAEIGSSQIDFVRQLIATFFEAPNKVGTMAVSQREGLLVLRYLGGCAESCKQGFELIWSELRSEVMGKPWVRPRIWNT